MADDLTAFLAARLDELAEKDWHVLDCSGMPWDDGHCCDAQRWLAREVAAGRAILAAHPFTDRIVAYGCRDFTFGCETCHDWDGATEGRGYCDTILALGTVYGDHPDYRREWAPAT
jgi:hypothetical protein